MPNWCDCELVVTGPAGRVREFVEFATRGGDGEQPFDFDHFVPYPPRWEEMDREFERWLEQRDGRSEPPVHAYMEWGYLWCCEHWGTNRNAHETVLAVDEGTDGTDGTARAVYSFFTAWSPPTPVVLAASGRFPDLSFDLGYFEPLDGYSGTYRCLGGAVTLDERGEVTHELVE